MKALYHKGSWISNPGAWPVLLLLGFPSSILFFWVLFSLLLLIYWWHTTFSYSVTTGSSSVLFFFHHQFIFLFISWHVRKQTELCSSYLLPHSKTDPSLNYWAWSLNSEVALGKALLSLNYSHFKCKGIQNKWLLILTENITSPNLIAK